MLGTWLSTACAIHCLVMPVVITALPLIGLGFLEERWFERAACGGMLALAALCLWRGCRMHREWRLLGLFALGGGLMLWLQFTAGPDCCAHDFSWFRAGGMGLGGLAIATAHVLNRRLCQRCQHPGCTGDHTGH